MPRPDEKAVIRISARGLRKAERMTDVNQKYIRILIQETIDEVGVVAQDILADYAPVRTGRLREGITITGRNRSVYRPNIRVGVENVTDKGFPYLSVTRFGRRAVEAQGRSTPARTYRMPPGGNALLDPRYQVPGPGAQRRPFRARMLQFEPGAEGSEVFYRRRVRAYRPKRDWVRQGGDEIKEMTNYAFQKVTREIEKVLKRPGDVSAPRRSGVKFKSRFGRFGG